MHSVVILVTSESARPDTGPYLAAKWLSFILQTVVMSCAFCAVSCCVTLNSQVLKNTLQ